MHSKTLLAAVVLIALAASGQQATAPGEVVFKSAPYQPRVKAEFEADTKLVEVGVVVRDPHGRPVAGLTKDDFEITDEGGKRAITAFSVETSPRAAAASSQNPNAAGAVPAAGNSNSGGVSQRYVALIFDDLSMEHGEFVPAQAAALRFVKEGVHEGDHAALFTMSGQQNVAFTTDVAKLADAIGKIHYNPRSAGRVDCPSMSAYEAYSIANHISLATFNAKIREAARCQNKPAVADLTDWSGETPPQGRGGVSPAGVQHALEVGAGVMAQAMVVWEQVRLWSRASLTNISSVVDSLSRMPGSRTILIASSGFVSATLELELDAVIQRALHAGIVINSIDAKGLFTTSISAEAGAGGRLDSRAVKNMQSIALPAKEAANDAVAALAYNTGGLFVHNRNDLDAGFASGIRPDVSYRLAFTPDEAPNGRYHHLRVRLKTPGRNVVQARLGYMALKLSGAKPQAESRLDTVAAADNVVEELAGDLTARQIKTQTGERGLMAVFHVDLQQLRLAEKADERQQTLSLIAMLLDANGNFVTGKEGTVTLALKDGTYRSYLSPGMNFTLTLIAPPGTYQLRGVMGEAIDGKVRARTLAVEIQ